MPEEARREAHVPTEQASPGEAPRLPPPDEQPGGPGDHPLAPPEGPRSPVGLIGRVRDRATFDALRRDGRRSRRGPVTVVFAPVVSSPPVRVAYGVSRRVGNAVIRNRVRRRLRSAMREIAGEPGGLEPGAYLVNVGPGVVDLDHQDLRARLASACAALPGTARPPTSVRDR